MALVSLCCIFSSARISFNFSDYLILIGNFVIVSQCFALPYEAKNKLHIHCMAIALIASTGFSISIYGITLKIHQYFQKKHHELFRHFPVIHLQHLNVPINEKRTKPIVLFVIWLSCQSLLIALLIWSLELESVLVPNNPSANSLTNDNSIGAAVVYEYFTYTCKPPRSMFDNPLSIATLSIIVITQSLFLVRLVYFTNKLRGVCF